MIHTFTVATRFDPARDRNVHDARCDTCGAATKSWWDRTLAVAAARQHAAAEHGAADVAGNHTAWERVDFDCVMYPKRKAGENPYCRCETCRLVRAA